MTQEEFEKNVMEMFLAGDEPLFTPLREQYLCAEVASREFTGHGFFTKFLVPGNYKFDNLEGRIDDVMARFENSKESYAFILYIENGKLDTLEGYSFGTWNDNYDDATLAYANASRRRYDLKHNTENP